MKHELRDYQARGLASILDAYQSGARIVLAVAPTGSGKTSVFTHLVSDLAAHGQRSLILVHRRELATQAATRLREFETDFGFIMAGHFRKPGARVQIASVQTLVRRQVPPASFVVCDEAHLSTAKTWATILEQYPKARILGVTATPWRLSGKPLVGAYEASVVIARPAELRDAGFLCHYNGFSYKTPDLSKVKTTAGDYNEQQSAAAMSQSLIVDNVVEEWGKHARGCSTVVFAVTVEHSKQLTARFKAVGVAAEHLDGSTSHDQRRAILRRVESGETQVLCNVGIAVEGLDIPRLKCCVLARPTKSKARAIQMMGRVRRPWNGFLARIHDHAFVIRQHGLPDDDHDFTLHAKEEKPAPISTCSICLAMYRGSACPSCGQVETEPLGERKLNTVADAEQYTFESGVESGVETQAEKVDRPPVKIKWKDIGREIEGVFRKQWTESTEHGVQQRYLIEGTTRNYVLPGTSRLNALMKAVKIPDSIRVTYTGETSLGQGRARKEFKVEVDEPEPSVVAA